MPDESQDAEVERLRERLAAELDKFPDMRATAREVRTSLNADLTAIRQNAERGRGRQKTIELIDLILGRTRGR